MKRKNSGKANKNFALDIKDNINDNQGMKKITYLIIAATMISATFADEVKIKTQVSRSSDTAGKALSLARNDANGYGRNYTPQTVTVKHIDGQYTAVILFTYTTPVINKKY